MQNLDHSPERDKLFEALAKAQKEIESAVKDKENPFFKSKYADLSSVWDACREPLCKNGLSVLQTVEGSLDMMFLLTTLGHSSGQWTSSRLPLMLAKRDNHGLGSAITYARRYALGAMVGVCSEEDDDANASTGKKGLGLEKTQAIDSEDKRTKFMAVNGKKPMVKEFMDSCQKVWKSKSMDEIIDHFAANPDDFNQRLENFKQLQSSRAAPAAVAA